MDVTPSSDELDLTPRTGPGAPAAGAVRPGGARRWLGAAVVVVVLVVGGFVVSRALGDATLFFREVDAAVAERDELADRRFRMMGLVVPGTVVEQPGGVEFVVSWNGVEAPVEHIGDPPELFQPDVPVVLEGRWSGAGEGAAFLSDRMLVRHDENYDAENPERLDEADEGGGGPERPAP